MIELNRSRNNVVLSRRAVLEEQRKEDRERILDRLQPGQVVEGVISNIVDFGAFVDLDGIDGLIHISELSWSHVNHPSEILNIGDTVSVKVLDIDRQRQRISLGLKQTQEDPWQRVVDTYNIGDELEGTVTKVVTFGAFVEILDGVEGLVHISELAQHHVENPREIIQPGDPVRVKILEIDSERRRLSLSIKRVEGQVLPVRPIVAAGELTRSRTCPSWVCPRTSSPTRFRSTRRLRLWPNSRRNRPTRLPTRPLPTVGRRQPVRRSPMRQLHPMRPRRLWPSRSRRSRSSPSRTSPSRSKPSRSSPSRSRPSRSRPSRSCRSRSWPEPVEAESVVPEPVEASRSKRSRRAIRSRRLPATSRSPEGSRPPLRAVEAEEAGGDVPGVPSSV